MHMVFETCFAQNWVQIPETDKTQTKRTNYGPSMVVFLRDHRSKQVLLVGVQVLPPRFILFSSFFWPNKLVPCLLGLFTLNVSLFRLSQYITFGFVFILSLYLVQSHSFLWNDLSCFFTHMMAYFMCGVSVERLDRSYRV